MANVTGYTKAGIDKLIAPLFSSISPFTVGGHYYSPVTYFWPDFYNEGQAGKTSKWAKTLAYGNALGYVIMNRSTGDWSAKDNDFLTQAQRASAAGAKRVLWYIPTRYGVASLAKDDAARNGVPDPDKFTREYIMQLCANLHSQYGDLFQGVFLDEVINGWGAQSGRVGWYGDLIGEIRRTYGKNFTIAINPGSNITEAVCALDFDVCMSFENTAAKYLTDDPNNPIANDVHFQKNMVISGDNASGKSTYLKTVAINAILAQGLGFAYGETLALPYGHVLTAMDVSDDIEVGDSYFITESKAILRMIQHLKEPGFHYFFIDELFKGTNTIERIGSGLGIVRWLASQNCLYMISSHDIELVAASGEVNDNYHFDSRYVDGKIVFDYQIKPGSAVTKNAVNTLESLHYPEEITQTAKDLIDQYEETGHWSLKEIKKE